jgi:hypothetical protein
MHLDCNTPRGQIATDDQTAAVECVLKNRARGTSFANTSLEGAAVVDGFFINPVGDVVAVAEVKTREATEEQFWNQFQGEWLLTLHKLECAQTISRLLVLPFYGALYLKPSRVVLFRQICDKRGEWTVRFRTERTETKATCNGGTAHRINAFLPMHGAHKYTIL